MDIDGNYLISMYTYHNEANIFSVSDFPLYLSLSMVIFLRNTNHAKKNCELDFGTNLVPLCKNSFIVSTQEV